MSFNFGLPQMQGKTCEKCGATYYPPYPCFSRACAPHLQIRLDHSRLAPSRPSGERRRNPDKNPRRNSRRRKPHSRVRRPVARPPAPVKADEPKPTFEGLVSELEKLRPTATKKEFLKEVEQCLTLPNKRPREQKPRVPR